MSKPSITLENQKFPFNELAKKFIDFYEAALIKSVEVTEVATLKIGETMNTLLQDSERIANLSNQSLDALEKVKEQILSLAQQKEELSAEQDPKKKGKINYVVGALQELSSKDQSISDLIEPIITALQYQDRIQQNFGNLAKFIRLWGDGLSSTDLEQIMTLYDPEGETFEPFGQTLYDTTTMEGERDILRECFTTLSEEKSIEDDDDGGISFF